MYKLWINFTKKRPFSSVLIAVCLGSLLGILIEYLLNRDFVTDGFLGLLLIILVQLLIVNKTKKD